MTTSLQIDKISEFKNRVANTSIKQYFLFTIAAYFLVGMHYFQPNYGGSGLDNPINPIGWIVMSILVSLGILQITKIKRVNYSPFLILLSIGCLILLIPLIYAPGTGWYSHTRLLGLFAGLGLLFSIAQMEFTTKDFHKVLRFILIAAFVESIFSLIQFYILPHQNIVNINSRRPSAIFFQANVAATFFVTSLLISLYLLQRTNIEKQSIIYKLTFILSPVTLTIAIVLLQSRTGFVGAFVGIIILLCQKHRLNKKWLALVILGISIAGTSLTFFDRYTRESTVYSSSGIRSQIYTDSIELILKKPIIGHGYGTFRKEFHDLQTEKYQTDPEHIPVNRLSHPHNELLFWLVEGGLIALISIVVILTAITYIILRQEHSRYAKFALIFPLSFHTLTELPFYHSVASWLTFLLLLALVSDTPSKQINIAVRRPALFRSLAALIIAVSTIQMISLLRSQKIITQVYATKDTNILLQTSLPFVCSGFEQTLNETKFRISYDMGLDSGISEYIHWAMRQIKVTPGISHYRNLIIANLYFNNIEQAQDIKSLALRHFPTVSWSESLQRINEKQQKLSSKESKLKVN